MSYSESYGEFFCDQCQGSTRNLGDGWIEVVLDEYDPMEEDEPIIEHICAECAADMSEGLLGEPWYWDYEHTVY